MMRRFIRSVLFFPAFWALTIFLGASEGFASPDSGSLFFTDEEVILVEGILAKSSGQDINPHSNSITLGAILFYGPGNWTVWLQGEKWTPSTRRSEIKILGVAPDHVRLSVESKDKATRKEIRLSPHQTYVFSQD